VKGHELNVMKIGMPSWTKGKKRKKRQEDWSTTGEERPGGHVHAGVCCRCAKKKKDVGRKRESLHPMESEKRESGRRRKRMETHASARAEPFVLHVIRRPWYRKKKCGYEKGYLKALEKKR